MAQTVSVEQAFNQALSLHQQGLIVQAKALYKNILQVQPQHIDALHLLGLIAKAQGQPQTAIALIQQSLSLHPNPIVYTNLGVIYHELQQFERALQCCEQALNLAPHYTEARLTRANALLAMQRIPEAITHYQQVINDKPNAQAHCNLGNALLGIHDYAGALKHFHLALTLRPDYAEALSNKGLVLQELGELDAALGCYNQAIALRPTYAKALYNRANLYNTRRQFANALSDYQLAIAIEPNYAKAHANQGNTLQSLKRYSAAIASYDSALALDKNLDSIFGNRLFMKQCLCDWQHLSQEFALIERAIQRGEHICPPFLIQALSHSASLQKLAAKHYAKRYADKAVTLPKYTHEKIRLAYFSSDFRKHPVSQLLSELFALHDREKFHVMAFSLHQTTEKDATRLKLEQVFDEFFDVSLYNDAQIVQLARQWQVDIAIDLNGHTEGCRTAVFAQRVAPIQINYLGYLGTMGAKFMDYIIADNILIPELARQHYSEKIIYLPHSFQANDSRINIAEQTPTRTELDLPESAFVFCCFNNHYKITPYIFAVWLRILQQVPNSVLWLLGDNAPAEHNLQQTAEAQGIESTRLIFAKRAKLPDYLAQHRCADLFLDTLPYNAGATASAALWAGLPLITCLGTTFSGRMASSLLNAVGLPELITSNLQHYESLAIQLAKQPDRLKALRQTLANNRLSYPLFNTALYAKHLDSAYQILYQRQQTGLAPDHIYIQEMS